jgi:1,4-alpha-glucan branching enzyme
LNRCYRETPALYARDFTADGFEWLEMHDRERGTIAFLRWGHRGTTVHAAGEDLGPLAARDDPQGVSSPVAVICNLTPVPRHGYRIGVPQAGLWRELLNSDAAAYGGSGVGNFGGVSTVPVHAHGQAQSLILSLPPLAVLFLAPAGILPTQSDFR